MTGKDLRALRRSARLTQGALAQRTGYSTRTICAFEIGEYAIPRAAEIALRAVLAVARKET